MNVRLHLAGVLLRLFNASSSSGNDLEYENSGARPDGRPADENAISNTLAEVRGV